MHTTDTDRNRLRWQCVRRGTTCRPKERRWQADLHTRALTQTGTGISHARLLVVSRVTLVPHQYPHRLSVGGSVPTVQQTAR
jgi:hypothetical protein